jgi:hypothetical protein
MRCTSCREPAGWWKRRCAHCATVLALYEQRAGELGPGQWLELFAAHGIPRAKVEAVLAYDPDGRGTLRDRMAADMTNRVLGDLGVASRQTAADVKRLREREGAGASTTRPAGDAGPPRRDH